MSVGTKTGFSLNGGHRSQGYVGQTNLSRSNPRTLAKGNTLKGSGGCCGTFYIGNSVISGVTSTEDPNVIKSSVINNDGMIATHYRWIRRPAPYTSVKPDHNLNNNSGGEYINYIHQKTIKDINDCGDNTKICNSSSNSCNNITSHKKVSKLFHFTKPQRGPKFIPKSQSEYLRQLDKKCGMVETYKPNETTQKTPVACGFVPLDYTQPPYYYCTRNPGDGLHDKFRLSSSNYSINNPASCTFPKKITNRSFPFPN
jgi:hypothetical protein